MLLSLTEILYQKCSLFFLLCYFFSLIEICLVIMRHNEYVEEK